MPRRSSGSPMSCPRKRTVLMLHDVMAREGGPSSIQCTSHMTPYSGRGGSGAPGEVDQKLAQSGARAHRMGKWQAQRAPAKLKLKPFRIAADALPCPIFGTQQPSCVQPNLVGVIVIHVRQYFRLGIHHFLCVLGESQNLRRFEIDDAAKARDQMRSLERDFEHPEIPEARESLGFRMARQIA